MPASFVHLHVHTCYSLLDGVSRIDDLLACAAEARMPALAVTDHGTMFAAIDFYTKAHEAGIKPIVGCEVYVADRALAERPGPGSQNYHLTLLAENETGYRNLMQLSTRAHLDGFYRKPRVDHALLERYSEGLVCLSGCASGELAGAIQRDDSEASEALVDWYRQVFDGRYYLEVHDHGLEFQPKINNGILGLSERFGLPIVATNDVHYVRQSHARAQEILLCIQTQTTIKDPKRMRMETPEFYLKSPEQMRALFAHVPGALDNSLAIAERCNLTLTFGRPHFPSIQTPDGITSGHHLRALCEDGVVKRYPSPSAEVLERMEYELSVIEVTGFVDYLLLVHDVVHFARSRGIAVGPGRGSAAGSLVSYCLFLTNVDPVGRGLSFERFLNPERVSMPDMDLDFADDRRDEVIQYVMDKYGRDHVAQIITFGTIGPRAGVRDVGRVLGISPADVDRVAKLVPFMCNKVAKAKEDVPELQHLYESDEVMRDVLDTVEQLEGVARHASTHAAGVVISRDPLIEHVPLYKVPKNEQVTTQYAMTSIEQIGLLKMDFLGLRTLTILQRACKFVAQSGANPITLDDISLEDPSIYRLLSTGDTFGVFQLEGAGMRRSLLQLKPSEFEHVVALLALYRPGPMDNIDEFCARKNGEREVRFVHPALEEVLASTYGIAVYQEQVMRLAVLVAGYTMGEGDLLRRAMAKKKPQELAKHRDQFIARSADRGVDRNVAEQLFTTIEPFAGYAFPKAHAAAYAVITCQTAYLKANFPREYLAGFLSAERENADKVSEAMGECRRLGVPIMPPDVNHSDTDFTLEGDGIRFGLGAIKHAGAAVIDSILSERRTSGAFDSLEQFCARVDWTCVNKRVVESLTKCGALDCLGIERARVLASLDRVVSFGSQLQRAAESGQASLFGDVEQPPPVLQLAVAEPATVVQKLEWEQELLGMPVSRHPVIDAESTFRQLNALTVGEVSARESGGSVSIGGLIRSLRSFPTKDGRPMATFSLTDLQSSLDAIVFSRSYEQIQSAMTDGAIVVVDGKLDVNDGRPRLVVDAVYSLDEAKHRPSPASGNRRDVKGNNQSPEYGNGNGKGHGRDEATGTTLASGPSRRITIELPRSSDRTADVERILSIYAVLQRHPGPDDIEILVRAPDHQPRAIPLPNHSVGYCEQLESELRPLLMDAVFRVTEPGSVC